MEQIYSEHGVDFTVQHHLIGCFAHQGNLACQAFMHVVHADVTQASQVLLDDVDENVAQDEDVNLQEQKLDMTNNGLLSLTSKVSINLKSAAEGQRPKV
jgi:hypothetical protein